MGKVRAIQRHRVMVSLPLSLYVKFHRFAKGAGLSDDRAAVIIISLHFQEKAEGGQYGQGVGYQGKRGSGSTTVTG